jgi:RNA polymerase sigma-70 factor (ECF subfamily)
MNCNIFLVYAYYNLRIYQRNLMINFQNLYESYATEVYRFSLWLAGDSSEAEDITSETFIRAWANNSKIRTETLKAYLFTISRNVYLERKRKRKRQVVLEDIYPDPAPGPDKLTESQLQLQRVQKVLQTFPEIDRAAFVLRVQHELPYDEISRVLELSPTAAKVKVYRVRKKLIAACIDKEVY